MKKIFLDCGQFDGVAIKQYCVDDSWTIYSFEPDPKYPPDLPKHKLYKRAVWTRNGRIKYRIDPLQQASHIDGIAGTPFEEERTVSTIDFSDFVSKLPDADLVVCSMDIEGAEFYVLPKMIEAGTIKKIDILDIEFHHRLMPDHDSEDALKLIQQLFNLGVIVRLKIVL